MTAFILVPGAHTGGWVWQEVADLLRESGAEAYPVTLTGAGDPDRPAGPGTDLETHIEDVLRLIDELGARGAPDAPEVRQVRPAPDIVLVGHGYGIHPAVGAADRRPERVARVVHLDVGIPQDGDPPLLLVSDQTLRERLAKAGGGAGDTGQGADAGDTGDTGWSGGTGYAGDAGDAGDAGGTRDAEDTGSPKDPGGAGGTGYAVDTSGPEETCGTRGPRDGWRIAAPARDGWARWGSTEGVPGAALDRLTARAEPQASGTLVQPLRLSGAVLELPVTGILCVANGSSIAMVEALVAMGDPRFQPLADPRVTFFELGTGHWPMLSAPDELAAVLLRAAAGEGHHVTGQVDEEPAHLRPFLIDLPERPRERLGRVDLYLPEADGPRPAVLFVHGGPVPRDVRPTPRDWPVFAGYGRFAADRGVVGATLDHRLHDLTDFGRAAQDVTEAVERVRADPRVDGERVALWFFSSGGLLSADWLAAPPPWLRCVAATYPVLAPMPGWGLADSRFHPATAVRAAGRLPIVLTRVGRERPEIAVTVEAFLAAAADCAAGVELIDVPLGRHGFETTDRTEQARHAVHRAMRSVVEHLRG